ncbi:YndM family protein [Bacillus sp. NEB1478]|uniref:YndM family protein n=1 Tax=Bacillus sp. NEB1478 TaxID=3073816 RepID=UPI0028732A61|nr:YndM family protein [Bacillus sp. NEB1478]WNB93028.1 YndM family protein [Bacillus sp. NEB1478]
MEIIKALLLKFIVCLIAFSIGLDLVFDASIREIISFSITTTAVTYILADRILLPRIGNRNTLMAEFMIVYAIVWLFGSVLLNGYLQIAWGSAISAILLIAAEVFVHRYLIKNVPAVKTERRRVSRLRPNLRYATEFAEETDPDPKKKK